MDAETERDLLSRDYQRQAARIVGEQLNQYPDLGIPVDPDIAEHMGALEEQAVSLADLDGEDNHDAQ